MYSYLFVSSQLPNDGDLVSEAAITYDSSEEESEDDSDDDDGWITPKNIDAINQSLNGVEGTDLSGCKVGCLTTDFAMQVLMTPISQIILSIKPRRDVMRCLTDMYQANDTCELSCLSTYACHSL